MDAERWLDENTFYCQRHLLRLTPAACARYRKEFEYRCSGCADHPEAKPLEPQRRFRKKMANGTVLPSVPSTPERVCSIPGCNEKHNGKGYCKRHYYHLVLKPKRQGRS